MSFQRLIHLGWLWGRILQLGFGRLFITGTISHLQPHLEALRRLVRGYKDKELVTCLSTYAPLGLYHYTWNGSSILAFLKGLPEGFGCTVYGHAVDGGTPAPPILAHIPGVAVV